MIVKIGSHRITEKNPFIIAEAGINHNGEMALAKELIAQAKKAGAHAVKFQTYKTENLLIKNKKTKELFNELKSYELTYEQFSDLMKFAKKENIIFLSTPDDIESFGFLHSLRLPAYKIGSGEINNYYFQSMIARTGKPVLLSTGTADEDEIFRAFSTVYSVNRRIIIMHCVSQYPAESSSMNLNYIKTLKKKYKVNIGLSDHSLSTIAPSIAVSLGASVIEKHFTLDNNMKGPDHAMSLDIEGFSVMTAMIRQAVELLGNEQKTITDAEKRLKKEIRKSIYSKREIEIGETLDDENTVLLRPQLGLRASDYIYFKGKQFKRKKNAYKPVRAQDVE